MEIFIVKGTGSGTTLLSAFDAALQDAGVSNYNIIPLSSIIPPHSQVKKIDRYTTPIEEWGHILYVVKAEKRSNKLGHPVAAGIGWYMLEDNKGLFVEHETEGSEGESEQSVYQIIEHSIKSSLSDLCKNRQLPFDESNIQLQINTAMVKANPTCVLTLAVFQARGWR